MHASRWLSRAPRWACLPLILTAAAPPAADAQPCEEHFAPIPLGMADASHVVDLAAFDDNQGGGPALYGRITSGGRFIGIGRWDGEGWVRVPGTVASASSSIAVLDDGSGPALYAVNAALVGDPPALASVARWDGKDWTVLDPSLTGAREVCVFDDGSGSGPAIYASGWTMTHRPSGVPEPLPSVIRWTGTQWVGVGTGAPPGFLQLVGADHDGPGPQPPVLYARTSNGQLLRLSGDQWEVVSTASQRFVMLPTEQGDVLVDTALSNSLRQWDGSSWSPFGAANGLVPMINTIHYLFAADTGEGPALYAAGHRTSDIATTLAKFHAGQWVLSPSAILNGERFFASHAVVNDGPGGAPRLYVGGKFTNIANLPASGVARSTGCHPHCAVDFDLDGLPTSGDITAFLNYWRSWAGYRGSHYLDFNRDGVVNSSDITAFLTAWLAALADGC